MRLPLGDIHYHCAGDFHSQNRNDSNYNDTPTPTIACKRS